MFQPAGNMRRTLVTAFLRFAHAQSLHVPGCALGSHSPLQNCPQVRLRWHLATTIMEN